PVCATKLRAAGARGSTVRVMASKPAVGDIGCCPGVEVALPSSCDAKPSARVLVNASLGNPSGISSPDLASVGLANSPSATPFSALIAVANGLAGPKPSLRVAEPLLLATMPSPLPAAPVREPLSIA